MGSTSSKHYGPKTKTKDCLEKCDQNKEFGSPWVWEFTKQTKKRNCKNKCVENEKKEKKKKDEDTLVYQQTLDDLNQDLDYREPMETPTPKPDTTLKRLTKKTTKKSIRVLENALNAAKKKLDENASRTLPKIIRTKEQEVLLKLVAKNSRTLRRMKRKNE